MRRWCTRMQQRCRVRACATGRRGRPHYVFRPMDATMMPMLAEPRRVLPVGDYLYEPKWDGLRCLAFVDGAEVDLRSRHGRPLARYFPELVADLAALGGR